MDELTALTKKRLSAMAAESKIGSDAVAKSLRCYETQVHPLLKERLSIWWDGMDRRSATEGRTFTYDESVAGMTGSNLMNYIFQSFYLQEPGQEVDVIYPRVSRKTSVLVSNSQTIDMFSEVTGWLGQYQCEDDYDVIPLRQLANQDLGPTIVQDLLDNTLNSSLSQGISELLFSNDFHFPSHEFVTVSGRSLNQDLIMKVKYYPSRDDNRAYCSDHSRLRSLVACCLNRMISPKSMATRRRLHSASILRPDKKDVLDLHLPLTDDEEIYTYLILADISNFTGSFANAWLMVYTMGLEVACGRLEDRYQLFSIGGKFLKASWKELVILYVYLTVGVPCWVESQARFGYLSGGFLGVGGNITIGLLCLAVVLQDLLWRLKKKVFDQRAQAGGDDIAIVIRCTKTNVESIVDDIYEELEAYVGKVKELDVHCLEDLPDGVIDEAVFCRKRIILTRDCDGLHLVGEPSVPIPESLFPQNKIHRYNLQIQAWRELDYSLRGWETAMPGYSKLTDSLRQLFLEQYRKVTPMRTHSTRRLTSSHRVLRYGNTLITDLAHDAVCLIQTVRYCGIYALSSYEAKVRHALVTEKVSMASVAMDEEELELVIMLSSEVNRLRRTRWVERIFLDFDETLLDELNTIVQN